MQAARADLVRICAEIREELEPQELTLETATTLAAPEKDPALWTERFYEAMADFKFLPAGRVIAITDALRRFCVERVGLPLLEADSFAQSLESRIALYREQAGLARIKAYINVGGGTANPLLGRFTDTLAASGGRSISAWRSGG